MCPNGLLLTGGIFVFSTSEYAVPWLVVIGGDRGFRVGSRYDGRLLAPVIDLLLQLVLTFGVRHLASSLIMFP